MSKYPLEGGTGSSGESQHLTLQKLPHWQTFFQESTHFVTLSFWNGVHWHRFIYVEHVFVKPHKIRFLPQDDNVWQPKDRRSRKMHPPLELYFKQFSLPKGDCRRCMANNLMFSTCTHAGLNWFRLLTEGQDKPLHWCGNVASWTVNMSIYCETQSHSVHWLSSPIFPCLSVSMVTSPFI